LTYLSATPELQLKFYTVVYLASPIF